MKKLFLGLAATFILAACSSTQFAPKVEKPSYNAAPITFNASVIEVVSTFTPRGGAPSIDHLMDYNPSAALQDWAAQRLAKNGQDGFVQFRIIDASVITRQLGKIGGVRGYFTQEQAEELVANVKVEISAVGPNRNWQGMVTAEASGVKSVPEEATPAMRKAIELQLLNELMQRFDTTASAAIAQHLRPVLVR